MRFQPRDGELCEDIYTLGDGVLARRHVKALHWPEASWRVMDRRLSALCKEGYLDRPTPEQYRTEPIPERILWLGWKGALHIAAKNGVDVEAPTGENENQMRKLHRRLRARSIRWVRRPRFRQLSHDLAVVDIRLVTGKSLAELSSLSLEVWVPESVFRSEMDVVTYRMPDPDGQVKHEKKGVRPDGYFVIVDEARKARGELHRARFLLELDGASFDNPRFGAEKIAAGAAYIKSHAYRERFGYNAGRWLIVSAAGEVRMQHLMDQAQVVAGEDTRLFFFTTLEAFLAANPLVAPIWWQPGGSSPVPLISSGG